VGFREEKYLFGEIYLNSWFLKVCTVLIIKQLSCQKMNGLHFLEVLII